MNYEEYLATPEWQQIRDFMLEAYPHCQVCSKSEGLQVHHNWYSARGDETPRNLLILCDECHERIHADDESNVTWSSLLPLRHAAIEFLVNCEEPGDWLGHEVEILHHSRR